jgi:hypothetical protein
MDHKACRTKIKDSNGNITYKDKYKYRSYLAAYKDAKSLNEKKGSVYKCEVYKCLCCGRYHVGRTNELLLIANVNLGEK